MTDIYDDIDKEIEEEDKDSETGSSGRSGKSDDVLEKDPFTIFNSVSFDDVDEKLNSECAKFAVHENRVAIKARGHQVEALNKINDLRRRFDRRMTNDNRFANSGGAGLKQHPELPPASGLMDDIIEPAVDVPNEPGVGNKQEHKLKNLPKFKQSQKQEYKIKYRQKAEPSRPRAAPPVLRPS